MPSSNIEKKKKPKWDKESIRQIAKAFSSRGEFAAKNKPAYEAARLLRMLPELFRLRLKQWDDQLVRQESAKYTTRTEFAKGSAAAYNAARRLKIIDQLYPSLLRSWDETAVRKLANTCASKKELKRVCATAYNAALRLGIIDDLFNNQQRVAGRDCVYLWSVIDEPGLYKFGITSRSMGKYRINQVAKEARVKADLVFLEHVGYKNAKLIELKMKRMGTPYKFANKFFGHSEFRYLSPIEVEECVKLSKMCDTMCNTN
jgi:hypothetical protein